MIASCLKHHIKYGDAIGAEFAQQGINVVKKFRYGDGVGDNSDNCPSVANADQADSDLGGISGSLDRTFGGDVSPINGIPDGFVMHAVSGSLLNSARAAVTDTDGTIYLAGHTYNASTGYDMILWRFTPAGALDTTFNSGAGYVIHHDAAGGNGNDVGNATVF